MYNLGAFYEMMTDPVRVAVYEPAIRAVVGPGDHVVDIGAGLGMMTFIALEAGAEHVWAVETNPLIDVARQVAAANGLSDRITFVHGDARQLSLPRPADVLLSSA